MFSVYPILFKGTQTLKFTILNYVFSSVTVIRILLTCDFIFIFFKKVYTTILTHGDESDFQKMLDVSFGRFQYFSISTAHGESSCAKNRQCEIKPY